MNYKKIFKLLVVFVMLVFLCACEKTPEFSEKGQIAVDKVKELQSYMKAPDTFILKDDVLVIEQDNEYGNIFVYISYTAENSYGVPLQDIGVFRNNEYCGSYYEMEGSKTTTEELAINSSSFDEYTNSIVQQKKEEDALKLYSDWQNGEIEKYEVISCKDIGKELDIEYREK